MEVKEIIRAFETSELLPEEALRAAIAQKEEAIPAFLEIFSDSLKAKRISDHRCTTLFLVIHLLAEFGETRAFPLLIDLLHRDTEEVDDVLGDGITTTLPRVIISTYDGQLGLLQEVILNSRINEFVRYSVLEALAYLTRVGKIELEKTEEFLGECFGAFEVTVEDHAWISWQYAISLLGLKSLSPTVKKAFQLGYIPTGHMAYEDFERDLNNTLNNPDSMASFESKHLEPFKDTIGELSQWYGFSEEYWKKQKEEPDFSSQPLMNEGDRNPYRHVGRNDPCPCGSGKKFKRCCLN